jgi:hypothetical protein
MRVQGHRPMWLYLLAVAALAACVWIGWSDFTPLSSQVAIKEAIRAAPREFIQVFVQFIAPALLVGFLAKEGGAYFQALRQAKR